MTDLFSYFETSLHEFDDEEVKAERREEIRAAPNAIRTKEKAFLLSFIHDPLSHTNRREQNSLSFRNSRKKERRLRANSKTLS